MRESEATLIYNGVPIRVPVGTLLSDACRMDVPCGAHARCGKCRIVASGALSAVTDGEREHLSGEELRSSVRLACCTRILGDAVATSIGQVNAAEQRVVVSGAEGHLPLDPRFSRYGVAIDIGTTTLAARLCAADGRCLSETGRQNPQIRFGADVISRIEAALHGKGRALAEAVRQGIDRSILTLAGEAGISPREIDGAVITGNTAMLYLLTETDPEPLSHAPFRAERLFGEVLSAEEVGLSALSGGTPVYLPPAISAFVGADTTCAILATELGREGKRELLADVGTNGEMALSVDGRLYVTSTAAGPAFEGVGISMGTCATNGAIDRVSIENGSLSAHVIGEGTAHGICGSGLVDAVACLLELEEIDETGYLENDPAGIRDAVTLTGRDVRMLQLAKSAISAGIRTLLSESGAEADSVASLYVAGGFGSYLDLRSADRIGLLPSGLASRAHAVGNAALGGATALLLSREGEAICRGIRESASVVELSTNPTFVEYYMEDMMF